MRAFPVREVELGRRLRPAAVGWHAHQPRRRRRREHNLIAATPRRTAALGTGLTNVDRRSAGSWHLPKVAVCEVANPSAVWRKERRRGTGSVQHLHDVQPIELPDREYGRGPVLPDVGQGAAVRRQRERPARRKGERRTGRQGQRQSQRRSGRIHGWMAAAIACPGVRHLGFAHLCDVCDKSVAAPGHRGDEAVIFRVLAKRLPQ